MGLSDFLTINISTAPVAPVQPGFGVMLILGAGRGAIGAFGSALIRYYTSTAAMLTDGYLSTDPEYLAASAAFAQTPAPPTVAIGRRVNLPTMIETITVLSGGSTVWAGTTAYVAGNRVVNGGNVYVCAIGGTSAGSGGPAGTGSGIVDGGVTWTFDHLNTGKVYTVTVNGVAKSYTALAADTNTLIATGLAAAIGTTTGFGAAVGAAAVITITASAAGNWGRFSVTNPNVDLDCKQTHADAGIVSDINNIRTADSTWYGVVSIWTSTAEVVALSAWTESNGVLYDAGTQDSTCLSAAGGIDSTLKTSAYVRSPAWYHQDNGAFLDAAIMANRFTYAPGSENWMFVTLAGVPVMALTATQVVNLKAHNSNYYYSVGISMTATGITPSGQFIDTVRGRDWLASRIQSRVFNILNNPASASNPSNPGNAAPPLGKVPFTDQGIAAIEGEIRAALKEGVDAGFLAANPAPTVTMPKAASLSAAQRASRILPNGAFTGSIAGAINGAAISGVVQF
jgi:hypothetical protein